MSKFHKEALLLFCVLVVYLTLSPFLSYAYDEAFYFQYFRWVYLYNVQPYFLWVFGSYFNAINIGSLIFNLPFYLLHLDNVLVQQFSLKLPLVIASLLTGLGISRIVRNINLGENFGLRPTLLFMLFPATFFFVVFFGNPLIISLLFSVLSLIFLAKGKPTMSSVLLGVAASTYLYPVFFFLPLIRLIHIKFGKKEALYGLTSFVLTLVVGQGLPLIISMITKTPLSLSILAPLFGLKSSITVTSSIPSAWGPYYIFYFMFGIKTITILNEIIYVLVMMIPIGFYFLEKAENITINRYIEFLFLESLIYVIFAITASPQYLIAIIPFSIILYFINGDSSYIYGSIVTFFLSLVLIFLDGTPLLYFLSNVHPQLAHTYIVTPSRFFLGIISTMYTISLFVMLYLHLKHESLRRNIEYENKRFKKTIVVDKIKTHSKFYIRSASIVLLVVAVITLSLVTPYLQNIPSTMYFTSQGDSGSSSVIPHITYNDSDAYIIKQSVPWTIANSYSKENALYVLSIPTGLGSSTNSSSMYTIYFNAHLLGAFVSSTAHRITVNASYISSTNSIVIFGDFRPNGSLTFNYYLPLDIPNTEILSNFQYLLLGGSFTAISFVGLIYIIKLLDEERKLR